MPSLPISTAFTNSAVIEAEFKTAITNQREFLAGLLDTSGNAIDALRKLGVIGADTITKSSAYTVVAADRGVVLLCSGTFTLSLTAAATLGDGFTFAVINIGTGTITIDPNSTELIDGASTDVIAAGSWAIVTCTGTAFHTMGSVPSNFNGRNAQLFVTAGTATWTKPNGVTSVKVTVIGGGGGASISYGGGRGGAAVGIITVSGDVTITVGAAGTGAGSSSVPGTAGGTSSFGTAISATGGAGGTSSADGGNGSGTVSSGTAIRTGSLRDLQYFDSGAGKTGAAVNWSPSSIYAAGQGAQGGMTNNSGVAGAVLVEW